MKSWIFTHLTRAWTAALTLAGLGAAFVYRPELVTLYLRTSMKAIEAGMAALPYPWGDRLEVILKGIGGSVWMQFAFAIIVVRVIVWLIARLVGFSAIPAAGADISDHRFALAPCNETRSRRINHRCLSTFRQQPCRRYPQTALTRGLLRPSVQSTIVRRGKRRWVKFAEGRIGRAPATRSPVAQSL